MYDVHAARSIAARYASLHRQPIPAGDVRTLGMPRVAFLFNAQAHQVLHGATIAEALAERWQAGIDILSPTEVNLDIAYDVIAPHLRQLIAFHLVGSRLARYVAERRGRIIPPKLLTLLAVRRRLNDYDAIALPERTSILLRRLGVNRPRFIHIDHGAGDRAAGFDPRIALFDFALLAGEKQRIRMMAEGLIHPERSAIVGYPKFEAADRLRDRDWTPFADDKPIILYNPHFSKELGSAFRHGTDLVTKIIRTGKYNVIIAPHIRMCANRSGRACAEAIFGHFRIFPNVHLDLGSQRSLDMTYTSLADIYLGDVSSQVYEFLRHPRPCVFVNSHAKPWKYDANYAHWHFGPVIEHPCEIADALLFAIDRQRYYASIQARAFVETFNLDKCEPCSRRAARAIAQFLDLLPAQTAHDGRDDTPAARTVA
jgi:hypothetical protein